MTRYNHAFDIAFEVISEDPQAEDVSGAMLRSAIMERLGRLSDPELIDCVTFFDRHKEE